MHRVRWETTWARADEIKQGDTLVTMHGLPDVGTIHAPTRPNVSEGFMEFCGLLLGDGNLNYQRGKPSGVAIARAGTAQYMDHYRGVIRAEFTNARGEPVQLQEADRTTRFSSVSAAAELEMLGFSGTARTKRVPDWVFRLERRLQLAFLRGFLDADGSIDKKGRISFSSSGKELIGQLRHLCMMAGVPVTNQRTQKGMTTLPNGKRHPFEMFMFTCSDSAANSLIGSHDPRYVERLQAAKPFGRKGRGYPRFGGKGFDSPGCELSRVAEVSIGDVLEPVYDLEVEDTHTFVADGVVVHNSNIEHQAIDFVTHGMMPILVRWEQRLNAMFFADDPEHFCEFVVDGLLRADAQTRAAYLNTLVMNGTMTRNEARSLENLNWIEGLDEPLQPNNMGQNGSQGPRPETAPRPGGARAIRVVEKVAERELTRERNEMKRLAKAHASGDALGWAAAVAEFYGAHFARLQDALEISEDVARNYCTLRERDVIANGVGVLESWSSNELASAALAA